VKSATAVSDFIRPRARAIGRHFESLFLDAQKPARLSIGMARIALAAALLMTLQKHADVFRTYGGIEQYASAIADIEFHAFGLLRPFGDRTPSAEVLGLVWNIAIASSMMSLVGLVSRPATVVAVVSTLVITTFREGSYPYWSHGYVVVMVAGLAFMFGQSGASLSLDSLLARWIRIYPFRSETRLGYWWPVAAGQAAIALFYFGAGVAKQINSGLFDWVFSDNLRFSLAVTWYGYEAYQVPRHIDLLMNNRWLWTVAAAGHVVTQFYPILSIFHKDRPLFRLTEGVVYVAGVYLLYFVMTVWNPVWLPLAVFFIDWDWLVGVISRSPEKLRPFAGVGAAATAHDTGGRGKLAVRSYLCAFFGFYVLTFTLQLGHWHLLYPFSSLDFYSDVKAKRPYGKHLPFDFYRGQILVRLDKCDVTAADWEAAGMTPISTREASVRQHCRNGWYRYPNITSTYPEFYRASSLDAMTGSLQATKEYLSKDPGYFVPGIREIAIEKAIWVYPAYPLPVQPVPVHFGLRANLDLETGKVRYVDSRYYRDPETRELRIDVEVSGFEDPVIDILYRSDVRNVSVTPPSKRLEGKWTTPTRFVIDEPAKFLTEGYAFALFYIRDRADPSGRVYEFWGPDNME
jgi:hypothetical protein